MNQRTWPRYASSASVLVIGIAALSLLAQLGMEPIAAKAARMSPATACCLLLFGGALWGLGPPVRRTAVLVLGSCVLAVALLSAIGHAFDLVERFGQLEIIRAPGTTFRIRVPVEVQT